MKIYELPKNSRALRLLTKSRVSHLVRIKNTQNGKVGIYGNIRNFTIIARVMFPNMLGRIKIKKTKHKCVKIINSLIKTKKLCKW